MLYRMRSTPPENWWADDNKMDYLLGQLIDVDPKHVYSYSGIPVFKVFHNELKSVFDPQDDISRYWTIRMDWLKIAFDCEEFFNAL